MAQATLTVRAEMTAAAHATAEVEFRATATSQARATADAVATAQAAPTATAQALEARYQRALGLINLEQWPEAQAELRAIFDVDPNYQDVQALLRQVNTEVKKLAPTSTSTSTPASATPTPTPIATATPTSAPTSVTTNGDFEVPSAGSGFQVYRTGQSLDGWMVESGSVDHIGRFWQAASGTQSVDLSGSSAGAIFQDLMTTPGQTYVLRFALAGNPECGPAVKSIELWWSDTLLDIVSFNTAGKSKQSMGWSYRQYEVVAAANTTRLRFKSLTDGACGPALDDVSITAASGR